MDHEHDFRDPEEIWLEYFFKTSFDLIKATINTFETNLFILLFFFFCLFYKFLIFVLISSKYYYFTLKNFIFVAAAAADAAHVSKQFSFSLCSFSISFRIFAGLFTQLYSYLAFFYYYFVFFFFFFVFRNNKNIQILFKASFANIYIAVDCCCWAMASTVDWAMAAQALAAFCCVFPSLVFKK